MSIYINGIEMPKDNEILCINIMANGNVYYSLDLNANTIANAAHVPPHGRMIDADDAVKVLVSLGERDHRREKGTICEAIKMLSSAEYTPTIIQADKEE